MESILIVDDDINLCEALSEELSEYGYETKFVTSADDALQALSAPNDFDLILLDLKMPGKDGLYVLNYIKNNSLDYKVIILTAYADIKSAIDSARLGATDFVNKPYDFEKLLATIRKVLQKEKHEN